MIFDTFRLWGKRFISIPKGTSSVHILTETGENYGSWMCVENFKKLYMSKKVLERPVSLGNACLCIRIVDMS